MLPRLRARRSFLLDIVAELSGERDQVNAKLKTDRAAIEFAARERRSGLNKRIAGFRDELAKVDRFLAADKPRGQRGAVLEP